MFKIRNGVVELTLPFAIDGLYSFLIPSERFADAVGSLKKAIENGEADASLKDKATGTGGVKTTRAPRKAREPGTGGAGWSDERRAKFAQTVAARKAAKA